MSTFAPDRLAELERRMEALERELDAGGDTLQSNVLTVDAAGRIGAQFTGKVAARGITIPAGSSNTPGDSTQAVSQVEWIDAAGGMIADIYGYEAGNQQSVYLEAIARDTDTHYSNVVLRAANSTGAGGAAATKTWLDVGQGPGGVSSITALVAGQGQVTFLDQSGASSFAQTAKNLSDLANNATARQNLGIVTGATGSAASGAALTVTHNLGRAPSVVLVTNTWADSTSQATWTVYAVTTTQFSAINKGPTAGSLFWAVIG